MSNAEDHAHPSPIVLQDKGLSEAFWPVLEVEKPKEDEEKNAALQWALRLGSAAALTLLSLALYNSAPDKGNLLLSNTIQLPHFLCISDMAFLESRSA